jgi:hypothetical protein
MVGEAWWIARSRRPDARSFFTAWMASQPLAYEILVHMGASNRSDWLE